MIARRPSGRNLLRMLLVTLPAAIACLLLAGCDDGYDVSILYTPREDWLVVESLKDVVPTRYDPPGMLPVETLDHPESTLFGPGGHCPCFLAADQRGVGKHRRAFR